VRAARAIPTAHQLPPCWSRSSPARRRPRLEALEDRLVPAAYHVTSLGDDGSAGTLRDAITQANANPGPDTPP